jgi:hypothetical protein
VRIGARPRIVSGAAQLAVISAQRGQAERAGRLWGAIESEHAPRPVPGWEARRAELEGQLLRAHETAFARARKEGRLLSIAQAAGLDAF